MKPATHGIWRPIRCLLLVACAGGILAADNSWISPFDFDFAGRGSWFSSAPLNDSGTADTALNVPLENGPRAQLSMGQLIHGLLFSPPARGWRLTSLDTENTSAGLPHETGFAWLSRNSDFMVETPRAASISMKIVSDGFVKESSSGGGILPTGPGGTTGNWIQNGSGDWSTASNWQSGTIPSGANSNAHFDTLNITTDVTVTLDSSRTVGELYLGDTDGTHHYTIAPSAVTNITFDNSGFASFLQQSSTSAGDTVSIPLFVKNDLKINNLSTTNEFVINSNIASSAATGTLQNLFFNNSIVAPGAIGVIGNITNGATGATVQVQIDGGFVNFSGTNTYSGITFVAGGTLSVKGDNSGATGTVYVSGSGSFLVGKGSVGGNVYTFGGTITGGLIGDVGALTLTQNLFLNTGEGSGTYWADLSGDTSDLLIITGTLQLGGSTTLDIHGLGDGFTTYVLATFGSRDGVFDTVMGVPSGYTLVYNADDIELVPTAIPEPATWIGGALALGAIGFSRQRGRRLKSRN